jgi:hypothetical protein
MEQRGSKSSADHDVTYRITVKGQLHDQWSDWFGGMMITVERQPDNSTRTTLEGVVKDQAALRGILNRLMDLNLNLVSVQQVQPTPGRK